MPDEPIIVDREVMIVGTSLGIIISDLYSDTQIGSELFLVRSPFVTFRKLQMFGGNKTLTGDPIADQLQTAIRIECESAGGNVNVSFCNFTGFNHAGVWAHKIRSVNVTDCNFIGPDMPYYNYAVWQQECDRLNFHENMTTRVRHAIGAHYYPGSYYATGNVIRTTKHAFDRHNSNDGTKRGGMHHVISKNTFLDPDRLAFSIATPYEGGSLIFTGNTLNHSEGRRVGEMEAESGVFDLFEGDTRYAAMGIMIHGNKFTD
jgi:hypothetical protein